MGKVGQAISQAWTGFRDERLLAVGVLNEIGAEQGEHIRKMNVAMMRNNKNRNGTSLGQYSPNTKYRRGKVDLNRSGAFHKAVSAKVTDAKIKRDGTATIEFEITVPAAYEGRVEGFRSGRYGKHGRAIKRPVLGLADKGTSLRSAQEKQLKRIATARYGKALSGAGAKFTSRDF